METIIFNFVYKSNQPNTKQNITMYFHQVNSGLVIRNIVSISTCIATNEI